MYEHAIHLPPGDGLMADPALWRAWCWCLYRAADRDRQDVVVVGAGTVAVAVAFGQFACQRGTVAAGLGVPDSTARNLMTRLMEAGRITAMVSEDKQFTVVSIVSPEQYITQYKKRRTSPRLPQTMPDIPAELDTPDFKAAWATWLTWRQQEHHAHARVGPQAARMALKTLAALGPAGAIAAIENSIGNGYQGIVPPRNCNGQAPQARPKETMEQAFDRLTKATP